MVHARGLVFGIRCAVQAHNDTLSSALPAMIDAADHMVSWRLAARVGTVAQPWRLLIAAVAEPPGRSEAYVL